MDKLTNFKTFVKDHPSLIGFVKNNEMTWQKFYELFDLYGSDNAVWDTYITRGAESLSASAAATAAAASSPDIFGWLKNLDLNALQDNISSIQRVVGVLQDLGSSKDESVKPEYKPRPIYKHFED